MGVCSSDQNEREMGSTIPLLRWRGDFSPDSAVIAWRSSMFLRKSVLLCDARPGEELKKGSYHAVFEYAVGLLQTVTHISDLFWIKMFYLAVLS